MEQELMTRCVIAGLQKLIDIANREAPYRTDPDDPYTPDPFPYRLGCSTGGIGMDVGRFAEEEIYVDEGLNILRRWIESTQDGRNR